MKNKEIIEELSKLNPEAEVGYEHQVIAYVSGDKTDEYIDLGWCGRKVAEEKAKTTGIYIVNAHYVKTEGGTKTEGDEINAVYYDYDRAKKLGDWLTSQDEWNGIKYTSYKIENFFVL